MLKARVFVTLKKSVFDPQGKTIHDALRSMGYSSVAEVRQGKFFELGLDDLPREQARETVEEIARKLLANPVIESYRVELDDSAARDPGAARSAANEEGSERK